MRPAQEGVLSSSATIADALAYLNANGLPQHVVADGAGWVQVTRAALEASAREGRAAAIVADELPMKYVPRLYPDLPVDAAMRTFPSHPVLPVVSRANRRRLVGTIAMEDVLKAYQQPAGSQPI
jgi:CBS domain-containing protein